MGLFGDAQGWVETKKAPLPKICHTYQAMMKLGTIIPCLKKIQKINEPRHTSSILLTSAFIHQKSANFAMLRNTNIDYIFLESLRIVLISMVTILIMSAKRLL